MHELSIAMSIIDVAEEEALRLDSPVVAVHLRVGPLSGVAAPALLSAYKLACEGTALAGSRLVITETPITAWCPTCNREQQIPSAQHICCPTCDTPTPKILGGRELEVTALEVQDPAPNRKPE